MTSQNATLTPQQLYEKKKIRTCLFGMFLALIAAITGAMMGAFNVSIMNLATEGLALDWEGHPVGTYAMLALGILGFGDCMAAVFAFIFNWITGRSLKEQIRTYRMPVSWLLLISAMIAGPLGQGLIMVSIGFCSLIVSSACSAATPMITALFSRIVFKERLGTRAYIGIAIIVVGVFVAGYSAPEGASNLLLGMFLALLGACGLGLEGVVSTYASDLVDPYIGCAFFRILGAGIGEVVVAVAISNYTGQAGVIGALFKKLFSTPQLFTIYVLFGLVLCLTYNAIYGALPKAGPGRSLVINFTIPFWTIPISFLFLRIMPGFTFEWTALVFAGGIIVALGAILIVCKPSELVNLRDQ